MSAPEKNSSVPMINGNVAWSHIMEMEESGKTDTDTNAKEPGPVKKS